MRRSEELVSQVEEDAPVRVHDSKSQMPDYPDRSKVKITASWLKRRARPNWAGKRKNGISRDALEMEHGLAATRAFFCDSVRRAAGRATAAVECAEDIANPLQRMGGLMDRGRRARLVAGVPRSSGRRSIAPLSLVC
jgi:hypothetical protein